ncbi:hypothetical protein [Alicyclobacillus vulcanalis]|uniref:Uncharacterized protein n=1 Tax=Alicyclobacillus vulcanalis TaxID=252246 RepID=A0A1N7KUF6_9BACL|nr:hypothetical protein [Alicyclobacillus vulcanalis]SIS65238.1 hypothetical protein SAMN05421799_102195 [Alicyclobacillus vulcanalis]
MHRWPALVCAALTLALVAGCGAPQPASNATEQPNPGHVTSPASKEHAAVDPKLYAVCNAIYRGVEQALAENRNVSFDTQFQSIQAVGSGASPSSPNGELFADAQQVVALWDAYTGEGAPAQVYNQLKASLQTLKRALDRYGPANARP